MVHKALTLAIYLAIPTLVALPAVAQESGAEVPAPADETMEGAAVAELEDLAELEPPPEPPPKLVILSTKSKGGPNLKRHVKKTVEKPLKGEYELISLAAYKKAGRKVKVRGKKVNLPENAQTVGEEAGATHVVFIEGAMERQQVGKRKKKVFFANTTIVEVGTGDVVFTKRYELKGRKITTELGETLVADIQQALAPPPPPPEPEPEPEPDPPPPPEAPPLPEEPVAEEPPPEVPAAEADALASAETGEAIPTEEPVAESTEPAVLEEPSDTLVAAVEPTSEETMVVETVPHSAKRESWRPGIHVGVGAFAARREAEIKAQGASEGTKPPCYCGEKNKPNPFFPLGYLSIELFPLAIGGTGAIYEGIGLHVEGLFTQVQTVVNETDKTNVTSNVFGANGGLTFRLVFWDSSTAPDFKLKLGASYFAFPLKKGTFPGVHYLGYYAGGALTFPIAIEQVALVLGGSYAVAVASQGRGSRQLGKQKSGAAFRGEGGVRIAIAPLEINLLARFEQVATAYTGTTSLRSTTQQFENAKLTDTMLGGFITAGVAF